MLKCVLHGVCDLESGTEEIEVVFATPVYPLDMDVGQPRGGGGIVKLEAWDNRGGGQYSDLYNGKPDLDAAAHQMEEGVYLKWSPSYVCRQPFLTDRIRIRQDTSGETGNPDWHVVVSVRFPLL